MRPRAAAPLLAIDADRRALQVALMADRNGNLLVGYQVFKLKLGGFIDDLRAALVAVLVANLFEFLDDDRAQLLVAGQDRFVLRDLLANLAKLAQDFVHRELREAIELQFEDRIHLPQREALFFKREPFAVELDDNVRALAPCVKILAGLGAGNSIRG